MTFTVSKLCFEFVRECAFLLLSLPLLVPFPPGANLSTARTMPDSAGDIVRKAWTECSGQKLSAWMQAKVWALREV